MFRNKKNLSPTQIVRGNIPKKLQHIYDYAAEETPGEYTIFLHSDYRCTLTNDRFFQIKKEETDSLKMIFRDNCYYNGCKNCVARSTSRCTKKCDHYYENRVS